VLYFLKFFHNIVLFVSLQRLTVFHIEFILVALQICTTVYARERVSSWFLWQTLRL